VRRRLVIAGVVAVLLLCVVAPLLLPKGPAPDSVPAEDLADEKSRFVELEGLTVHYRDSGSGEPALFLIHGFGSSAASWDSINQALSADRRVVALDRTGFGLTSRPLPGEWEGESPYSIDSHAEEGLALMDDLGIAKTVLVGHSQGAAVALALADRHPERVEGVVLVAPELEGRGVPAWLKPLMRTPQLRRVGPYVVGWGDDVLGDRSLESAWHDPSAIPEEERSSHGEYKSVEYWEEGLWEAAAAPFAYGLAGRAQALDTPVLIVVGDDDRVVGTDTVADLAEALPDAEFVILEECGHVAHEECADEVSAAISSFLEGM
jgi:pimeloyl-ACP methyl ester carboxylesterase